METRQRLICEFEKNGAEVVRVHLVEWKGQTYFDIRVWFKADDGVYHPSTKGIRLNSELLPNLRSAIDAAISALEDGPEVEITQDDGQEAEESRG